MLYDSIHTKRDRAYSRLPVDFYRPWHESAKTVTFGGDRPSILPSLRPYVQVGIRLLVP